MNIAVREERAKAGKLLSDRFILLLSGSYSLLVCLMSLTSPSNETLSLGLCKKERTSFLEKKKIQPTSLMPFFTYIPLFLLSLPRQLRTGLCFPLTQVTAFYSESHFSLMDILSTGSF